MHTTTRRFINIIISSIKLEVLNRFSVLASCFQMFTVSHLQGDGKVRLYVFFKNALAFKSLTIACPNALCLSLEMFRQQTDNSSSGLQNQKRQFLPFELNSFDSHYVVVVVVVTRRVFSVPFRRDLVRRHGQLLRLVRTWRTMVPGRRTACTPEPTGPPRW